MSAAKMKVAWLGLGKMGRPLAVRLIEAGYQVTGFDPALEDRGEAELQGIGLTESAARAAAGEKLIFTMVTNDRALEEATIGPKGALAGADHGSVLIDLGTHSVATSQKVARQCQDKGVDFLRAPVSGTTYYAAKGLLTVWVSGPGEVYDRCRETLSILGRAVSYVGPGEEARYLKLLHNAILGVLALTLAEAVAFGRKGGLNWAQMIDLLAESVVGAPVYGYKAEALKNRSFELTFTAEQMIKDLDLALAEAASLKAPLPLAATVRQFMEIMPATGRGQEDFFAVIKVLEELGGLREEP